MSSVVSTITLSELCFPDITGKSIRAWGLITFGPGTYVKGGLAMGLLLFADGRTVDFNGFLRCKVWNEDPVPNGGGVFYTYRYSPVTDTLQIFNFGVELATGAVIPAQLMNDDTLFLATWNRTTVLG